MKQDWLVKLLLAALLATVGYIFKMSHDQCELAQEVARYHWQEQVEHGHISLEDK